MKNIILFLFPIIFVSCNSEKKKNNLEESVWDFCGDKGNFIETLDFRKNHLSINNDTIHINWYKTDSIIGIIEKIENHYGARRLYVKDLSGKVGRYCEQ